MNLRVTKGRERTIKPQSNKKESGRSISWSSPRFVCARSVGLARNGQNKTLNMCQSNDLKSPVSLPTSGTYFE